MWYRALDAGLLGTTYAFKRLSGYEVGLVDYYPMDEGSGQYATDKAQGANAALMGANWAMPQGLSLRLEKTDKGIELNRNAITRTKEQDYTLTFWFRTDEPGAILSNGTAEDEADASQFYIGFDEDRRLVYRSGSVAQTLGEGLDDGTWHHYAMTVSRAQNVANIYVDRTQRASFKPGDLGGISGGRLLIGAAASGTGETADAMSGNVDELCLFQQALPLTLIRHYATHGPKGDEAGLVTYLSFDQQQRQHDNSLEYIPYIYNRRLYKDQNGNVVYEKDPETGQDTSTPQRDYWFTADETTVLAHIDRQTAAPILPSQDVRNLDFSFVGRDNQLLVNIDEQSADINKHNIYVTLRDVTDKNGNAMASPVTQTFYVDQNPVRWLSNKEQATAWNGMDYQLDLGIVNHGGVSHTYKIENCPRWLTFDDYENVIAARSSDYVTATISKNLNVGTYDEIIYLTDEDGFSEPLYLTVTVEGEQPDWMVDMALTRFSMNIVGRVLISEEIDTDSRDMVGVFDRNNVCHGVANIDYDSRTGESLLYLNVYNDTPTNEPLYFMLWNYATGLEMMLDRRDIVFSATTVLGSPTEPELFRAGSDYVQTLNLEKGWNWISFNVYQDSFRNADALLNAFPWKNGDALVDNTTGITLTYKDNHWVAKGAFTELALLPSRSYFVKVQDAVSVPISGRLIKDVSLRTVSLKKGWNCVGYTPMMNLPVETALSDYYDEAQEGDVVKSHDEFAYFTKVGGVGRWQGSLKYMRPGEGYMLLRHGTDKTTFTYPFYEPGSRFLDETASKASKLPKLSRLSNPSANTMSMIAIVDGIELEEDDRLVAYCGGERAGEAALLFSQEAEWQSLPLWGGQEGAFYLSIEGEGQQSLWFAIERDGEIVATTANGEATFIPNAVLGTPDTPTCIHFVETDAASDGWYSLTGIRLPSRPTQRGIYIHNCKKYMIE